MLSASRSFLSLRGPAVVHGALTTGSAAHAGASSHGERSMPIAINSRRTRQGMNTTLFVQTTGYAPPHDTDVSVEVQSARR